MSSTPDLSLRDQWRDAGSEMAQLAEIEAGGRDDQIEAAADAAVQVVAESLLARYIDQPCTCHGTKQSHRAACPAVNPDPQGLIYELRQIALLEQGGDR